MEVACFIWVIRRDISQFRMVISAFLTFISESHGMCSTKALKRWRVLTSVLAHVGRNRSDLEGLAIDPRHYFIHEAIFFNFLNK